MPGINEDWFTSNFWFGPNSIWGTSQEISSDFVTNLGDANWWFGENSFWGALNVKSIGPAGVTFYDQNNPVGSIARLIPYALVAIIVVKIFK